MMEEEKIQVKMECESEEEDFVLYDVVIKEEYSVEGTPSPEYQGYDAREQ